MNEYMKIIPGNIFILTEQGLRYQTFDRLGPTATNPRKMKVGTHILVIRDMTINPDHVQAHLYEVITDDGQIGTLLGSDINSGFYKRYEEVYAIDKKETQ